MNVNFSMILPILCFELAFWHNIAGLTPNVLMLNVMKG